MASRLDEKPSSCLRGRAGRDSRTKENRRPPARDQGGTRERRTAVRTRESRWQSPAEPRRLDVRGPQQWSSRYERRARGLPVGEEAHRQPPHPRIRAGEPQETGRPGPRHCRGTEAERKRHRRQIARRSSLGHQKERAGGVRGDGLRPHSTTATPRLDGKDGGKTLAEEGRQALAKAQAQIPFPRTPPPETPPIGFERQRFRAPPQTPQIRLSRPVHEQRPVRI